MSKRVILVKGIKRTLRSLEQFGKEADVKIHAVTGDNATTIAINARRQSRLTSFNNGKLTAGIVAEEKGKKSYEIIAKEKYSAYVEFGTGTLVEVPEEMYEIADQFRARPKIREVNLPARPFLYPAFVEGRKKYLKDLKNLLNKLTKKYE